MSESAEQPRSGPSSPAPESTSSSLLERVKARDAEAWRRLVSLYGPIVYHWCRRMGLQPEDAADRGQEVFIAVAGGIAAFQHDQPGQTFRGWLWTITQNKIRDHFRQTGKQPPGIGGSDFQGFLAQVPGGESAPSTATGEPEPCGQLLRRGLEMVRGEIEERTWQAFWRVVVDGRSPADVGAELNMAPTAVRKAKSRVLQRLRQELGDLPAP